MAKFIELTRHADTIDGISDIKIRVNVEHIEFYYDKCIVFHLRSIEVLESYDEITKLLEEQL
jgi:hypothetical protein